ncbi:MAG: IS3 family transposase [Bacteroidia bacterium]|nr:IS3 family transposase [Bacteroidia bacterium]
MKQKHKDTSLEALCGLFGHSRQAWYQGEAHAEASAELAGEVLILVRKYREVQPRLGTRKLQHKLNLEQPFIDAGIEIGRDWLHEVLRENGLLVRRRRVYRPRLTNGNGESIYPDLRKQIEITAVNQLWSCDITYLELSDGQGFLYLTLITDEKSHLILGYHVSARMTANETIVALQMAIASQLPESGSFGWLLAFHSDRGGQFKSALIRNCLNSYHIHSSMCEKGKSWENPVSERINGILKDELGMDQAFVSLEEARAAVSAAVHIYNHERPHLSCGLLTPAQAHQQGAGPLRRLWKNRRRAKRPAQQEPGQGSESQTA